MGNELNDTTARSFFFQMFYHKLTPFVLSGEWVTVQGRFKCVSLTCMSSSCTRSPMGLSPSAHLADGTGDLVLVWDTNPLSFLRFLYRHTSTDDQVGDFNEKIRHKWG